MESERYGVVEIRSEEEGNLHRVLYTDDRQPYGELEVTPSGAESKSRLLSQ